MRGLNLSGRFRHHYMQSLVDCLLGQPVLSRFLRGCHPTTKRRDSSTVHGQSQGGVGMKATTICNLPCNCKGHLFSASSSSARPPSFSKTYLQVGLGVTKRLGARRRPPAANRRSLPEDQLLQKRLEVCSSSNKFEPPAGPSSHTNSNQVQPVLRAAHQL